MTKLPIVPSQKIKPFAKVGGDQIHLATTISKVGGDASHGTPRVIAPMRDLQVEMM